MTNAANVAWARRALRFLGVLEARNDYDMGIIYMDDGTRPMFSAMSRREAVKRVAKDVAALSDGDVVDLFTSLPPEDNATASDAKLTRF